MKRSFRYEYFFTSMDVQNLRLDAAMYTTDFLHVVD